jgi:hypothetical protein
MHLYTWTKLTTYFLQKLTELEEQRPGCIGFYKSDGSFEPAMDYSFLQPKNKIKTFKYLNHFTMDDKDSQILFSIYDANRFFSHFPFPIFITLSIN